jgi:hypothetical protein
MGSMLPRLLSLWCVLASTVAQNVTVPLALAGAEGGGGTNIPFGSNQACRIQCIYEAAELPWTGPRVITGLLLRPDLNPLVGTAAKGFLDISVLVSTTDKTSATASATFLANRGADATWVMVHQLIQLPAQPAVPTGSTGPRPANIPLMFQVPWAYGLTPAVGSLPAPSSLLVEIHIHSQPSGLYRVDNLSGCAAPSSSFGQVGPACASLNGQPVTLAGDPSMLAGNLFNWQLANAPPSMPFLVTMNLSNTGGLAGNPAWPLPYPMFDPANPALPSPALASLGWPAPDCYLNVDPVAALGGVADTSGAGLVGGQLPPGQQFLGTTIYAQALVFAPTINPLRFITSLGYASTVCGPLGVVRVYAFYNSAANPPVPEPTAGTVQYGAGFILDVM